MGHKNNNANEHGRYSAAARWKRAAVASAIGIAIIAVDLVTAAPASAGECSETGGSSNTLIWTGSTYACAYVAESGNKSIGQMATQSWSSNTPKGYKKKYACDHQTGGVTITNIYTDAGGTSVGSSITYTAFNASSGSRHWNAAVLWTTNKYGQEAASNQFLTNCTHNDPLSANLMYVSNITLTGSASVKAGQDASYTVTVAAPDGGGPAKGTVAIMLSKTSGKDVVQKDCSGNKTNAGTDVAVASAPLKSDGTAILTVKTLTPSTTTPTTYAPWPAGSYYVYAVYGGMPTKSITTSTGAKVDVPSYCMTPPQKGLTPAILKNTLMLTVN